MQQLLELKIDFFCCEIDVDTWQTGFVIKELFLFILISGKGTIAIDITHKYFQW
ncbi:MAG: hypothetical protein ACK5RQ_09520 [Bacteroidota bacterium]